MYEGKVVTGDQFISSKEKKAWLVETFDGCCTEMEGAAIAHVAYLNQRLPEFFGRGKRIRIQPRHLPRRIAKYRHVHIVF